MIGDYRCADCHHIFEYKKPYGKEFPKRLKCKKCGSMKTKKLLNAGIIVPDDFRAVNSK